MSDKAAGQKARSPEGCDENGPAAALLLSHVSIQICSFLSPVRLGPPCRRPLLIATPLPQSLTRGTSRALSERFHEASWIGTWLRRSGSRARNRKPWRKPGFG